MAGSGAYLEGRTTGRGDECAVGGGGRQEDHKGLGPNNRKSGVVLVWGVGRPAGADPAGG